MYDSRIDNVFFLPKKIYFVTDSREITTLARKVSVDSVFGIRDDGG